MSCGHGTHAQPIASPDGNSPAQRTYWQNPSKFSITSLHKAMMCSPSPSVFPVDGTSDMTVLANLTNISKGARTSKEATCQHSRALSAAPPSPDLIFIIERMALDVVYIEHWDCGHSPARQERNGSLANVHPFTRNKRLRDDAEPCYGERSPIVCSAGACLECVLSDQRRWLASTAGDNGNGLAMYENATKPPLPEAYVRCKGHKGTLLLEALLIGLEGAA